MAIPFYLESICDIQNWALTTKKLPIRIMGSLFRFYSIPPISLKGK